MYERGSLGHGFFDRKYGRKNFPVNDHLISGLNGSLESFCDYGSNSVTYVAGFEVEKTSVMRRRLRLSLAGLHVVSLRCVIRCKYFYNSRNLHSLGSVDAVYISRSVWRPYAYHVAGVRIYEIFYECTSAGYKLRPVYLSSRLTDDLVFISERRSGFCLILTVSHLFLSEFNCEIVMLISCVTNEYARETILNFFLARIRIVLKKPCEQKRGSRGVVGRLDYACVYKRFLNYREILCVAEPVRRDDFASVDFTGHHEIGHHRNTVNEYGVTSAESFGVVRITNSEVSLGNEKVSETHGRIYIIITFYSVNNAFNLHVASSLSLKLLVHLSEGDTEQIFAVIRAAV